MSRTNYRDNVAHILSQGRS